jgi:peptide/nickel transport system substrate-binding protein/oligopeptide transport system substrate-binding protein
MLAMPNAAVLPGGSDASGTVGTGPWVLAERVRDSHLSFRANPHWHGRPADFDEVHVRILPDEFTRVAEFEVGHLDVLEVPPSQAERLRAHVADPSRILRQIALVTEYVGLDNEDPVLADVRVRRALNYGVNVAQILATVIEGRGVRSVGAIPPTLPGSGGSEPYEYDPERARALLAEANLPEDWTLELWQRPAPLASQVLEAIQADLKRIGVAASIRVRDWSALKASIDRGETQAFFINWYADYPDAENFLVPLFHSANIGGGGNRARFADAATDAALDALDSIEDAGDRARAASEIDRRVHDLAPWIYLWHPILEIAVAPRIEGYRPMPVSFCERWLDVRATPSAP